MTLVNQPVQMLSICEMDGQIRPFRFRYEDSQHQLQTVRIAEIIATREVHSVGVQSYLYICKAICHERELLFELRYMVKQHKWMLQRILN